MTIRKLSQRYGYIAALLVLSLAVGYAIPLLHAHPKQSEWSDKQKTSGWAWVGGHSIGVQGGKVVSRSEHQCGIWNKSTKPIRIHVAYDHKLQENGSVVADDTYDSFLEDDVYKVGPDQYFTTSDVDANYVRSASTTHDPNDSYKFQPYTKIVYERQAQARAMHTEIDL